MAGYTFHEARPADQELILNFVYEHFVPHEPINSAINLCGVGYRMPYFDNWLLGYLNKKDTLVLMAKDDAETLLGLVIIEVEKKQSDSNHLKEEKSCPIYERCPEKLQKIFDFLDWLDKNADIENTYQVNQWGDIMILACRSNQRVPGLGTALIEEGIRLMEERGVSVLTTTATSHFSSRIFMKLGFKEVMMTSYEDYKVDGEVVFKTSEPHTHARKYVRKK